MTERLVVEVRCAEQRGKCGRLLATVVQSGPGHFQVILRDGASIRFSVDLPDHVPLVPCRRHGAVARTAHGKHVAIPTNSPDVSRQVHTAVKRWETTGQAQPAIPWTRRRAR